MKKMKFQATFLIIPASVNKNIMLKFFKNLTFVEMIKSSHIHKFTFAVILLMAAKVAIASFSFIGISDERNKSNKYSLKNLSHTSHNTLSLYSLKSELQYKGSQSISPNAFDGGMGINSMMQYDRGNTTFILPYKFKINLPKDKIRIPIR